MSLKEIKKLVDKSYVNGVLDEKTVFKIASFLKRKDLKDYIKQLQKKEKEITVEIYLSKSPSQKLKEIFSNLYKNKKIVYKIDKKLIAGIKIIKNDIIQNVSIASNLNQIALNIINIT